METNLPTNGDNSLTDPNKVSYLLASEETTTLEFGVYQLVQDNYPKYVLTLYEIDFSRNGIKHHHIRDFLLMEDWG